MTPPALNFVYSATVERIVDGDTVELMLDLGFKVFWKSTCRFARINAPEKNTPEGVTAKAFLVSQLPVGTEVIIRSTKLDKYGRGLIEIWKSDVNLNDLMLYSKNAVPYDGKGPR